MNTELKPIPIRGAENYQAGSDGHIYSRQRVFANGDNPDRDGWHKLKGSRASSGYVTVTLATETGRRITKNVHKLVCMAFHGLPPKPSLQVRHLDGNNFNNAPENLKWGTQLENCQDRMAHGRYYKGEKHHASKFTDKEREHIYFAVSRGLCSQRNAARILGVGQPAIQKIIKRYAPKA